MWAQCSSNAKSFLTLVALPHPVPSFLGSFCEWHIPHLSCTKRTGEEGGGPTVWRKVGTRTTCGRGGVTSGVLACGVGGTSAR